MKPNLFCTMAIGEQFARAARYLVADLADYDQPILVLTDASHLFKRFKNAIAIDYKPDQFSYHDKRIALKKALELSPTAVYVDADCVFRFGLSKQIVKTALQFAFPPGFHGWKVSRISDAGAFVYPETESLATRWGLVFDRNRITYQEMLFALTAEGGKERSFFEIWNRFAEEAKLRNDNGSGEGVCIGIAAQSSGITCWDSKYIELSLLSRAFWHCHLDFNKRQWHRAKTAFFMKCGIHPPRICQSMPCNTTGMPYRR